MQYNISVNSPITKSIHYDVLYYEQTRVILRTPARLLLYFETNHRSAIQKYQPEQNNLFASAIKYRNEQLTSMIKYVGKNCYECGCYSVANIYDRHSNAIQEVGSFAFTF